jgi:hypothetical protein
MPECPDSPSLLRSLSKPECPGAAKEKHYMDFACFGTLLILDILGYHACVHPQRIQNDTIEIGNFFSR